jgi:hypothetical protein
MTTTITEVDTYTTPVTIPVPGEQIRSNDWVQAAGALANRTKYILARVSGLTSGDKVYFSMVSPGQLSGAIRFSWSGSAQWQGDVTTAGRMDVYLPLPKGAVTITGVVVAVDGNGAGASHSALPATMPTVELIRQPLGGGAPVSVSGPQVDTSGTFGAYDTAHVISIGAIGHTIVADNAYYLKITGEAGANSVAGALAVYGGYVTVAP